MSKTSAVAAKALTSNFFELFGVAPAFALDLERLERSYRDIQSKVHPDRFVGASDAERRASMQAATRVNEAYRALKSPVRRAKYLLELNGVDLGFETNTAMPREFLMEQMELRERLEGAKNGSDLDLIARDLAVERLAIEKRIRVKIDDERDLVAATDFVRRLMFLVRFGEEIDAAYEALES